MAGADLRGADDARLTLQWSGHGQRAVAAALSIAATLGLLVALTAPSPSSWVGKPDRRPAITVRLLAATPPAAEPPSRAVATSRPMEAQTADANRRVLPERTREPRVLPQALPITAPQPTTATSINVGSAPSPLDPPTQPPADPPTAPASAPLKLDAATLRAATRDIQGQARRQAEASGQEMDSAAVSQAERLGAAVKNTGKADCLTAGSGAGLLAPVVIAYSLLKDTCK